jgi:hypothetical protein
LAELCPPVRRRDRRKCKEPSLNRPSGGFFVLYQQRLLATPTLAFSKGPRPSALSTLNKKFTIFCQGNVCLTNSDDSRAQVRRNNSVTVSLRDDDVISRKRCGFAPSDAACSVPTGAAAQKHERSLRGVLAVEESAATLVQPTKRDLILLYWALAIGGCLIAVGIVIYPDSRQAAPAASADVPSIRDIGRNH